MSDSSEDRSPGSRTVEIRRLGEDSSPALDLVAIEEPLALQIDGLEDGQQTLAVTLRTPGRDHDLALGFLFAEGLVQERADVEEMVWDDASPESHRLVIRLSESGRRRAAERTHVARSFPASSACGLCGRPSLDDLWMRIPEIPALGSPADLDELASSLPERMRARQELFRQTGGVHAAGLFSLDRGQATLVDLAEDVGRHNAIDKVVGRALEEGRLPLDEHVLVSSGRAGFEIVQKAVAAGTPAVIAVGAPSSLACELATLAGIRLYAFAVGGRVNLLTGLDPAP